MKWVTTSWTHSIYTWTTAVKNSPNSDSSFRARSNVFFAYNDDIERWNPGREAESVHEVVAHFIL